MNQYIECQGDSRNNEDFNPHGFLLSQDWLRASGQSEARKAKGLKFKVAK